MVCDRVRVARKKHHKQRQTKRKLGHILIVVESVSKSNRVTPLTLQDLPCVKFVVVRNTCSVRSLEKHLMVGLSRALSTIALRRFFHSSIFRPYEVL